MNARTAAERPTAQNPAALSGLLPFLRPYRLQIALAALFLVLAAAATLLFPVALRHLIDAGFMPDDRDAQALALRGHFLELFGVAVAVGLF
jgi:ATP-binding cassette subfamily B protein